MGDNQPEENFKHKQQDDSVGNTEPTIEIIKPKSSIANVYYDCLERIFEFLDLGDLLSVAQTCKRLQIAAAANFHDRYGKMLMILEPNVVKKFAGRGFFVEAGNDNYGGRDFVCAIGMAFCLQFLRCFGSRIEKLYIERTNKDARYGNIYHIDHHVNKYCADTLARIVYCGREEKFLNHLFVKPFKKLTHFTNLRHNNFNQLSKFVDWFPNLRHLDIDDCSFRHCTSVYFPFLEHLSIRFACDFIDGHYVKIFNDFLRINKHVNCVNFSVQRDKCQLTMSKILDIIDGNRSIFTIDMDILGYINVNASELLRLASEHLMMFTLKLGSYILDVNDAITFIGSLEFLEFFEFRLKNRSELERLLSRLNSEWTHQLKFDEYNNHQIITLTRSVFSDEE